MTTTELIKTSELTGAALDWAVAKCEGYSAEQASDIMYCDSAALAYSTDWAQGGPIIEREKLNVSMSLTAPWMAFIYDGAEMIWLMDGPTPLIATMRCYVASKLGDEVEIPIDL
jgi:hypothetical protein